MTYDPKVIEALARLRDAAANSDDISNALARDFQKLDNAGVFAALDEQTDYAAAEEILAEAAIRETVRDAELDPAEWGDTTREDQARHQADEPLYGAAADRIRDELDKGDREAMSRLAKRALTQPDMEALRIQMRQNER